MNSTVQKLADQVLENKIKNGDMFTAYDVTLEVRSAGHRVKHDDVKEAVHDFYGRGEMGVDYIRSNISFDINGVKTGAFLYHRQIDDVSSYKNSVSSPVQNSVSQNPQQIVIPNNFGANTPAPTPVQNVSQNTSAICNRKVDGRNTLSIPVVMVKKAGFQKGQKAYVYKTTNGALVSKDPPPQKATPVISTLMNVDFGFSTKYTVDNYSQIRITQGFLKKVGIPGNAYDLDFSADNILVKLSK